MKLIPPRAVIYSARAVKSNCPENPHLISQYKYAQKDPIGVYGSKGNKSKAIYARSLTKLE
jgi:hypothetical protein